MHPMEQFIRKIMNMYHSLLRLVFNKLYSPNSPFASNLIVWLWQRAVSFSCKIFEYFVLDTVRWCRRKPGRNSISFIQTLLWNWTLFNFCSTNSAMEIAVGMIPSVCMLHDMDVSCRMLTLYRAPIRITPLEKLRQRKDRTSRFWELQ